MAPRSPRVLWIGVGTAGCRVLRQLATGWTDCPPSLAAHTRTSVRDTLAGTEFLPLGQGMTGGLGTGGDAEIGRKAAEVSIQEIEAAVQGADFVVLITGLGGGTGSGAAPVIAEAAHRSGAMTMAVCTLPFFFEGAARRETADRSLVELKRSADAVILFPNQRLMDGPRAGEPMVDLFDQVADVVASSLRALWKLLTQPGVIQWDFADLRRMVAASGGVLAMAQAEAAGDGRAAAAAAALSESPLLEHEAVIGSATSLLVGVTGGPDLTLWDIQTVVTGVCAQARAGVDLHFGAVVDPEAGGRLQAIVLATEKVHDPVAGKPEAPGPEAKPGDAVPIQTEIDLKTDGQGRFLDVEPTVYKNSNLDDPTYLRRGLKLAGRT
jgi:cell division protein FtsZ